MAVSAGSCAVIRTTWGLLPTIRLPETRYEPLVMISMIRPQMTQMLADKDTAHHRDGLLRD